MMDAAKTELARRALACKGWRWMPGMVTRAGNRASEDDPAEVWEPVDPAHSSDLGLPDLDDPATLGCLLALVREAWSDRSIYVRQVGRRGAIIWAAISFGDGDPRGTGDTEVGALVAALGAAPESKP